MFVRCILPAPCSQPPLYWCIFWEMVVRISGDFWGKFNDGENLRSTFLLSPEHIFSLDKSPDHILRPYFTPEHRDFGKSYWNQALFQNKRCNCANLRKVITTKIWNSAVNHMLKSNTKALFISRASTFAEKNKFKYVVLVSCVCIFKLVVKRNQCWQFLQLFAFQNLLGCFHLL